MAELRQVLLERDIAGKVVAIDPLSAKADIRRREGRLRLPLIPTFSHEGRRGRNQSLQRILHRFIRPESKPDSRGARPAMTINLKLDRTRIAYSGNSARLQNWGRKNRGQSKISLMDNGQSLPLHRCHRYFGKRKVTCSRAPKSSGPVSGDSAQ